MKFRATILIAMQFCNAAMLFLHRICMCIIHVLVYTGKYGISQEDDLDTIMDSWWSKNIAPLLSLPFILKVKTHDTLYLYREMRTVVPICCNVYFNIYHIDYKTALFDSAMPLFYDQTTAT